MSLFVSFPMVCNPSADKGALSQVCYQLSCNRQLLGSVLFAAGLKSTNGRSKVFHASPYVWQPMSKT